MAKPYYTLDQVLKQLQSSWGDDDTDYRAWTGSTVSYFIGGATVVGDGRTGESKGWTAMAADQVAAVTNAFTIWGELVSGLSFVATNSISTAGITVAYSSTTNGGGTYTLPTKGDADPAAVQPVDPIRHEAVWLSTGWPSLQTGQFGLSTYGPLTILHEIGHALGLSHPGPYDASNTVSPTYEADAVFAQDTRQYTIMSYFFGETANNGWTENGNDDYPSTPMVYDIAAIQRKYGANFTTRDTDTTYGFNSTAGWDFYDFAVNTHPVFTIWDGGGVDTIDASGYAGDQSIDLNPGHYSSVMGLTDNIAVAYYQGLGPEGGAANDLIENAVGGSGDDTLTGNDVNNVLTGNAGNDTLRGGWGGDTLLGGDGDDLLDGGGTGLGFYEDVPDVLTGGAGHDTFVYGAGYHHTMVTDFSLADDTLDVSGEAKAHDLRSLMSFAYQYGNDLVFDFGASGDTHDVLTLQNVSYGAFEAISPLSVLVTASPAITITPNPSATLEPMMVTVAPLAGGGFVAVRFAYADIADHQILGFRYDATGRLIDSVQVNTGPSDAHLVRAIGLGSGRTAVIWESEAGGRGGTHAVLARLLAPDGTPIGGQFQVNSGDFQEPPEGPYAASTFLLTVTPSSDGTGADIFWVSEVAQGGGSTLHEFAAGLDADGNVVGSDEDFGQIHSVNGDVGEHGFLKNLEYYAAVGTDGRYHAYYDIPGQTDPVQLDDGDLFGNGPMLRGPLFQAIALTDGRILFSYISGYNVGYSEAVNADKVIILDPDLDGFTKPGTDGDDYLQGGPGHDHLFGGLGDDTLMGMGGGDLLDGGPGTDTAAYTRSQAGVTVDLRLAGPQGGAGDAAGDTLASIENLVGSSGADVLDGDAGPNRIEGGAGNDVINGNGGADTLIGGAGNDVITLTVDVPAGGAVPQADGGDGNDTITVNGTANGTGALVDGGDGNDAITVNADNTIVQGGYGDDTITLNGNNNTAYGGTGRDSLVITAGTGNRLEGGDDDDTLTGGPGDDRLEGGAGDDAYRASPGHDTYFDVAGTADQLIYRGSLSDFAVTYDPATATLTIDDTRPGAPEGSATITGIDTFSFRDGDYTLAQVVARATVPVVDGRVADGYVAGATVFNDTNGNGTPDAGEAATVTDALGRFTLPAGLLHLVATGGTDIATGLPLPIPLSAPAGYAAVTAVSTLVDAFGGSMGTVLAALNLDPSLDLPSADPVAGTDGRDGAPFALFVTDTMLMDTFVAASAFVASVRGTTVPATFRLVLDAFTSMLADGYELLLAAPDLVAEVLNRALAGTGADPAQVADVVGAITASNLAADARGTLAGIDLLRNETAVAITAQGDLATALAGSAEDIHDAALAYTGASLDAAIAGNLSRVGNVDGAPCYNQGTLIATPGGEVPVEMLAIGDRVLTRDGRAKPIRWIGRRGYAGRLLRANPHLHPVRFAAGSLGAGLPRRDLLVSPDHAMFLDGLLVPAALLVNAGTITREHGLAQLEYFHIELDAHDVLLAEGAESETFLDDDSRQRFHNAAEHDALQRGRLPPGCFCAPRVTAGEALEAIRRRLRVVGAGPADIPSHSKVA